MKGYRKFYIKPNVPLEQALRRKREEAQAKAFAEMLAAQKAATAQPVSAETVVSVETPEPKDATQP